MAILKLRGIDTATGQHTDINEMEWNDATPQLNVGGTGVSRVLLRGETSGVDAGRIQSVHLNTTDTSRLWAAMILDHNTTGINPAAGLGSYIRFRGYDDTDTIRNMMDLRTRVVLGQSTNWTTEFELWLSRGPSSFENPFN